MDRPESRPESRPDRRPLFTRGKSNAKTAKGYRLANVDTLILHMAPDDTAGGRTLCSHSTPGCRFGCLYISGRSEKVDTSVAKAILAARVRKAREYLADPAAFIDRLSHEVTLAERRRAKSGTAIAVRPNGTSDQPKIGMELAARHPTVMFYDYTAIPRPWLRQRANYRLTFSLKENNQAAAFESIAHGVNVAVVFDTKVGEALPATFYGIEVIDGDAMDLRYLDETPAGMPGVFIGLRAKGRLKHSDPFGFVVKVADLPTVTRTKRAA